MRPSLQYASLWAPALCHLLRNNSRPQEEVVESTGVYKAWSSPPKSTIGVASDGYVVPARVVVPQMLAPCEELKPLCKTSVQNVSDTMIHRDSMERNQTRCRVGHCGKEAIQGAEQGTA
jgi:hypothetical protein